MVLAARSPPPALPPPSVTDHLPVWRACVSVPLRTTDPPPPCATALLGGSANTCLWDGSGRRRERYDLARPDAKPWLYGIASRLIARRRRAEVRQYRALAHAGLAQAADDGHADRVVGHLDAQALRGRLAAALAEVAAAIVDKPGQRP